MYLTLEVGESERGGGGRLIKGGPVSLRDGLKITPERCRVYSRQSHLAAMCRHYYRFSQQTLRYKPAVHVSSHHQL